ncbi:MULTISPECIES: hypothetical protein [unclassified Sphingobacterium]|uniref:hypothetical protein n=1 Tax=unclassified Sphingobacterium TaxID=2609468 RepID=UPI0025F9E64E|nr:MULTISPECIES: hypothetical protein [unclassified Sphingobacterium]
MNCKNLGPIHLISTIFLVKEDKVGAIKKTKEHCGRKWEEAIQITQAEFVIVE